MIINIYFIKIKLQSKMGNNSSSNSSGGGSYRSEKVVSAHQASRPKEGVISGPFSHHGVVVNTDKGNSYLIHNGPSKGVVCTDAKNMSSKWSKGEDIKVSGNKTVNDAMRGGYT